MARISVVIGKLQVENVVVSENVSVGALWDTGLPLSNNVEMQINGEVLARGVLCTYEGRFAVHVSDR